MDTEWFAVDKDGHVARFVSKEAGAVPRDANIDSTNLGDDLEPSQVLLHKLSRKVRTTGVLYERTGRVRLDAMDRDWHWLYPYTMDPGPVLMFLLSLDPVRRDLREGRAIEVPAISCSAVIFKDLKRGRASQLHRAGVCLGCFYPFDEGDEKPRDPDPVSLGLYAYIHTQPDTIAGPYARTRRPVRPLHISDVPNPLRKILSQVRLDSLCFGHTPQLQPVALVPCHSWEAAWLDLDSVTQRCVPGKEKEYRAYYRQMKRALGHAIEPPAKAT
jgi:hypothetical protein